MCANCPEQSRGQKEKKGRKEIFLYISHPIIVIVFFQDLCIHPVCKAELTIGRSSKTSNEKDLHAKKEITKKICITTSFESYVPQRVEQHSLVYFIKWRLLGLEVKNFPRFFLTLISGLMLEPVKSSQHDQLLRYHIGIFQ